MPDLVRAAKTEPGSLTYGSWFAGSPGHIGAAMLEAATGTQMTHVPFKEMSQLFAAVAKNEITWSFGSAASSAPMYRAKKVRYLAVVAPHRIAGFGDIPTVTEAGGPANFEVRSWVALLAPHGTPAAIIARINAAVAKALAQPDIRQRLAGFGFEPLTYSPNEISALMETDTRRFAQIIKHANLSLE